MIRGWHRRKNQPLLWALLAAAGALSVSFQIPPAAADNNAAAARGKAAGSGITDAQVVSAMEKGIDFLLSAKKGDNWEPDPKLAQGDGELGGATSIAVYALLHAGESLQDDPVYHGKLNWRSPDMAPAIAWLCKNKPTDTYVAGLEASALTLLPHLPNQKPGEGPEQAMNWCKWYLLSAMGKDGGYTYTAAKSTLPAAWEAYFKAAERGKRDGPERKTLDQTAQAQYNSFGGPRLAFQKMAAELREKAQTTTDRQQLAEINAELREMDRYMADPKFPAAVDPRQTLANNEKALEADLARHGDPKGMVKADPTNPKKRVPLTREDLAAQIKRLQDVVKSEHELLESQFTPYGDLSNGQYGTLGAWALADYDPPIEFPNEFWKVQDHFWRKMQDPDGGWPYRSAAKNVSTPTMGLAGIASLYITQEFVDTELRLRPKPDKVMDSGLAWLVANYTPAGNLYYQYGVERVGLASGLKFFGTHDWYKEGAADVLHMQGANGSWTFPIAAGASPIVGTSYALLFLARGRNPVAFNKLQYNGPWNARPRDDDYITRSMSKRFEKPINWQVVNLQVSPDEWMDAPVLLITGSQDPKFTKEDIAKLRAYIDAGGMIFSTADGSSLAFTKAMRNIAVKVVDGKYEWRQLPKSHPLFSEQMGVHMPNPPVLYGLSNGIRELWIHSPTDVGAAWQMRRYADKPAFELGAALYFYGSGMGSLKSKLQPLAVHTEGEPTTRTIDLARLDYAGNSDPEPGAWARMTELARNFNTELKVTLVKIPDLDPKKFPIAHLTGTAKVTFTPDEVKALRAYVDGGGFLFIDAAGGSRDFADSCTTLVKQIYPKQSLSPLPPDDPIYTGSMTDGEKLATVDFRKYGNLELQRRVTEPELEQVVTDNRTRILFSKWDICSGFLGTNTWGIIGYAPATAEILGRNILLYSQNPKVGGPANAAAGK